MNEPTIQTITSYIKKHRQTNLWVKIVTCMAAVVVFVTTYALILPAITMENAAFCGFEEHQHSEENGCYERKLVCEQPEGSAHTHTEECFETELVLSCNQTESEAHTHSAECYAPAELTCGQEESESHVHSSECYSAPELICGKEESEGHIHGDSCYETKKTLICELDESEGYTHTDSCYEMTLICDKPEHTHSLICYSDTNADLENAENWEKTFEKVDLTGKWDEDLISIAKSQLGYTESEKNYTVVKTSDGEEQKKGYSRYGAWYGDAYGDWCAMFVSFCLHYAGADKFPLNASCPNWVEQFQYDQVWIATESYTPQPGDIIFFDYDQDQSADHVGIVEFLDTEEQKVHTIEGNTSNMVARREYSIDDVTIFGYCSMELASENYELNRPKTEERILEFSGEDYKVTVRIPPEANLPETIELKVRELTGEEYEQTLLQAMEAMQIDQINFARFFDIAFVVDGEEIEPEAAVDITISSTDPSLFSESEQYQAIHFAEDGVEILDTQMTELENDEVEFSFSQDSFSVTGIAGYNTNVDVVATADTRSEGITMNLFDYYIGSSPDASAEWNNQSTYDSPRTTGINAGTSRDHSLQFYSYGTAGSGINNYTGGTTPRTGIVSRTLTNGYPTLSVNGNSLAYLFDTSNRNGKMSYPDVNHLLQVDADGYYYYNSDENYAEYHSDTKDFAVYSTTYKETCGNDSGDHAIGFFPFNTYNSTKTCVKNFNAGDNHSQNQSGYYNHHFGLTMEVDFLLTSSQSSHGKDITFEYSGDDDMWVFIDGVLVLDIGGIHERSAGSINFRTGAVHTDAMDSTLSAIFQAAGKTWDPSTPHHLQMFYLERGGCYSNLEFKFNIPVVKDSTLKIKKRIEGANKDDYLGTDFHFYLELETGVESNSYAPYNGSAVKTDASGNESTIQVTDGAITLRDGERICINDLSAEQRYRLKETDINGRAISKVDELYSGTAYSLGYENAQEVSVPEKTVGARPTNEFVNHIRPTEEIPTSVRVQKQWSGSEGDKPAVAVQLYREGLLPVEGQQHQVNVSIKCVYNGRSVNELVAQYSERVPDGGTAIFKVDTTGTVNSAISTAYIVSGNAGLTQSAQSGYQQWFDGKPCYPITEYTLSNVTSDVDIVIEYKSYWTEYYVANLQWLSIEGDNAPTEPISSGIEPYGDPVTLSTENGWQYEWNDLPKTNEDGVQFVYYLKELNLEGYDATYEPNVPHTANDGAAVYKVEDGRTICITNTVITHDEEIPVEKRWSANAEDYSGKTVYLVLCDSTENPILDENGFARLVKLDQTNDWKGKFTVTIPYGKTVADMTYVIREVYEMSDVETHGYQKAKVENDSERTVYYQEVAGDQGIVTIEGKGFIVHYTNESDTWIVTNSSGYRLPETGGPGSFHYVYIGIVLMFGSLIYGCIWGCKKKGGKS